MGGLIKRWIPFVLFVLVPGIVVLFGYLMPGLPALIQIRDLMVEWAVIIAAFAFLLGMLNILRVHGQLLRRRHAGWFHSLILIFVMLLAWIPPALQSLQLDLLNVPIPARIPAMVDTISQWMFRHIISPLGASLAALLVFTLALAVFRMFRVRPNAWTVVFIATVIIVLLGSTPFTVGLEVLTGIRSKLINVWGMAGIRGLLLGVALGIVVTALRVFIASEQPYSES